MAKNTPSIATGWEGTYEFTLPSLKLENPLLLLAAAMLPITDFIGNINP